MKSYPRTAKPIKPYHSPKPPKSYLLAVGYCRPDNPLVYEYRPIGHFPTKTAAKQRIEELKQEAPDLLFLILETNPSKQAAVYQKFAAALNA